MSPPPTPRTDTNEQAPLVDYPEELLTSWHRWYSSDESDGRRLVRGWSMGGAWVWVEVTLVPVENSTVSHVSATVPIYH